ncbi:sulfotransferase family 2 domain-containing protein [Desulfurivibrio alkaliphilus]|uniref:Sulfotransferase family protein n=1 Tax=Desulfurivibrio alkaliphilus (strain DSM 19089 / UNIQEM U267 / AHT2) TaxID=589865 RepID=D6Z2B0_DESAT|nr:sulfotransferase family 2 domain-containing protein [Desulfurivibrio alkaliphilus]ADH85685.1 conserved hypothetical protein [Desulfurivibrio alkaliphilus AHT 2]
MTYIFHKKKFHKEALRFAFWSRSFNFNPQNNGNVAVYPAAGIIYNRIKKSGNSSVLLFLQDALEEKKDWTEGRYHEQKRRATGNTVTPFGLRAKEIFNLKKYYSFTIMRNPYSRCLSAFLQKVAAGKERYRGVAGFGQNDAAGFESFVAFLENGGLYYNKHWWPQVDLLFWPPEYFFYIGKLERLEEELRLILSSNGITVPESLSIKEPHPSEQEQVGKVTNAGQKMARYYTEDLYDRIFTLYRRDFEVGGYHKNQR